jgi:hypothetical protein
MDSKLYKLDIRFTEVKMTRAIEQSSLRLLIASGTTSNYLKFQVSGSLSLPNFSPDGILDMRLEEDETPIAVSSIVLGRICDKTITGEFSKWVKFEPDRSNTLDGTIKVKISGSLRLPRRGSPAKQRPGYLSASPQKNRGKCLYIRKLYTAEEREKEIQNIVLRVKSRLEQNYGDAIEDGLKSPSTSRRSPTKSPLRKKNTSLDLTETFDIEIPSRFNLKIEYLSSKEPLLLKHTAIGLCDRIKVLRAQVEEYQAIELFLDTFDDPMKDLKQSLIETKDQLLLEDKKVDELILTVQEDKKVIEDEYKSAELRLVKFEDDVNHIRYLCDEIKVENEQFKFDQPIDKLKKRIQKLRKQISDREEEREILLGNSQKMLAGFSDPRLDNERSKLLDEKFQNLALLQGQTNLLDQAIIQNFQYEAELAVLSAQISAEDSAKARNAALQSQKMNFSSASETLNSDLDAMCKQRDISISEGMALWKKIEIDIKDSSANQNALKSKQMTKDSEFNTLSGYVNNINKVLQETSEWIQKDEKEFNEQHSDYLKKYYDDRDAKDTVLKEFVYFSDLVFMHAQSGLIESRLHKRLDEMVDEKEHEKGSMEKILNSMKQAKPAYIARGNDPIDASLAKYLNSRERALEVNFIWTAKGAYNFGSRPINLINEEGKLYVLFDDKKLAIEDFIEGYELIERERLNKLIELKRSSTKVSFSPTSIDRSQNRKLSVLSQSSPTSRSINRSRTLIGEKNSVDDKF